MSALMRPGVSSAERDAMRGGMQLFVAAFVSLAANYVFLLVAGRLLGSRDYSTLAALSGLLTVVLLPSGALQMAVSREVSRREALGDESAAASFVRAVLALGLKLTVPVMAVGFALIVPLRDLLNIGATAPVAIALVALVAAFLYPVALGALQGYEQFRTLAYASALPIVGRLAVLVALAVAGMRLYGALAAVTASAVGGVAFALWPVRKVFRLPAEVRDYDLRPFLRYLFPVAVGLFGISLLTNGDILVVKARFSAEDAGVYAAASAFARVAFFLPATILAVLFPRTAARQARGERSDDILGRSLFVTAAFCAALTCGYALVGHILVRLTYGPDFAGAANLLVPFCIAMTLFSLTNVLVAYHLSRGELRFAWIVAGGVVLQLLLLGTIPTSLREVLWLDAAVGGSLLLAHEIAVGSSVPALAAGFHRLGAKAWPRRAVAFLVDHRFAFVEAAAVLAGYSALAVAITWPLAAHLHTTLPGAFPNDSAGGAWWYWQLHQEGGYHLLGLTHHTLTGAPLGWDQGNALNFQWLLPNYPGYLIAGPLGGVAALNLVALSGLVLSGAAMYLLVRWLRCPRLVAAWAGLVYVAFPWHLERVLAGHVTLVHLEAFPLVLLAGLAWLRRPGEVRGLAAAAAVACAWLTSGYFGAMALIVLIGVSLAGMWVHRSELGVLGAFRKSITLWGIPVIATAGFALIAVLAGGTEGVRLGRASGDVEGFGAHLRDYLPDPLNPLAGSFAVHHLGRSTVGFPGAESILYPGLLTIALALIGVGFWLRRRLVPMQSLGVVSALVMVVVMGVAFAAPSPMSLFGLRVNPMPSYLLYKVLPAFRVPARQIAVIMVGLVPLAAVGLSQVATRMRGRVNSSRAGLFWTGVAGAVALAASIAELPARPFPLTRIGTTPPAYAAVAKTRPGVLAEYPLVQAGTFENSSYVSWQVAHGRPLLNGASFPTPADALRRMLVDPRAPGTAEALALLGVTSIVTRADTYQWRPDSAVRDTPSYGSGYQLVQGFAGDVRVWRVVAEPAPAIGAYASDDVDEGLPPSSDGFVGYPVLARTVHLDIYAKTAGVYLLHVHARGPAQVTALRIGTRKELRSVPFERDTAITVTVSVSRGRSRLTIVPVVSSGTGHGARLRLSRPWFTRVKGTSRQAALTPVAVARNPGF